MAKETGITLFDRISDVSGRIIAWLTLFMVLVTTVVVLLQQFLNVGYIWMQESVIWMHAAVFMLGAAYTLLHEDHVRVDIFYRAMSDRRRAIVDGFGVLIFLLPLCVFLAVKAWDFAAASWDMAEASRESGGLPYPFVPLLKSVLIVMPIALALQGLSLLVRSVRTLRGR